MKRIKLTIVMLIAIFTLILQTTYAGRCTAQWMCDTTFIGCAGEIECTASNGVINCDGVENSCPIIIT